MKFADPTKPDRKSGGSGVERPAVSTIYAASPLFDDVTN